MRAAAIARRAAAAALALAMAAAAAAQDAATEPSAAPADDPFAAGAFEAGASPGAAAAAPGGAQAASGDSVARTEYLVGGAFSVSASGWLSPGLDGYAVSSSASGKLFAKVTVPDYGSLFASYSIRQAFLKGLSAEGPSAFVRPESLSEPTLGLAELHYSLDLGKKVFLRLGKQLLAWGPSFVWTPVDFVNAERADAFAAFDARAGISGLKATVPLGPANVIAFADFSGLVEGPAVRDPADALKYAARVDAALGGFEWGLSGSWGPESQAKAGFDFSGYLFGTTLYGEVAAGPGYSGYDPFVQAALGFSRALGDLKKWTLSGEGFYNSLGSEPGAAELGAGIGSGALTPLYIGTWYAYAALKAQDLLFKGHDATLSALANLTDRSFQAKLAQDFDLRGAPPFSVSIAYNGGGGGKELTAAAGDGSLELSLRTKLEF
jgi:hypothetical protein